MTTEADLAIIKRRAEILIEEAVQHGVILTITLVPLEPLAMGNHKMVAEVVERKPY